MGSHGEYYDRPAPVTRVGLDLNFDSRLMKAGSRSE
jgi:hypothetical protein